MKECGAQSAASKPVRSVKPLKRDGAPCFYEGKDLHDVACPSCTEMLLQYVEDEEFEVKEKYRGKLRFLDKPENDARQELLMTKALLFENEPWKLN